MKFLVVLAFVAAASADVSHLKQYLPPHVDSFSGGSDLSLPTKDYLPPLQSAPLLPAPLPSYGQISAPAPVYDAPAPVYQAPAPVYHAPAPVYHAPEPVYQPAPQVHYQPAPQIQYQQPQVIQQEEIHYQQPAPQVVHHHVEQQHFVQPQQHFVQPQQHFVQPQQQFVQPQQQFVQPEQHFVQQAPAVIPSHTYDDQSGYSYRRP